MTEDKPPRRRPQRRTLSAVTSDGSPPNPGDAEELPLEARIDQLNQDLYAPDEEAAQVIELLKQLRRPIADGEVEKLPKPMWKNAWENGRKGRCDECGGYHVLENTIHLDYFGHARTTGRLLEIDPFWDWEPLQYDSDGFPKFDRNGGLWIKLTVCGVTRKGYGHANGRSGGDAVKEIIGDAIRNAAMRFGVALELWTKGEIHDGKNPPADTPRQPRRSPGRDSGDADRGNAARAANQDALDALTEVCDDNGLDARAVLRRYADENGGADIRRASTDDIYRFASKLLEECSTEPAGPDGDGEPPPDPGPEMAAAGDRPADQQEQEPADADRAGLGDATRSGEAQSEGPGQPGGDLF